MLKVHGDKVFTLLCYKYNQNISQKKVLKLLSVIRDQIPLLHTLYPLTISLSIQFYNLDKSICFLSLAVCWS